MNQETLLEQQELNLRKYQQAGWGFLIFNVFWFFLFFWFLPPFNLGLLAYLTEVLYLVLVVVLSRSIYKGSRKLTIILAAISGCRSIVSMYTLTTGEAFTAVPFVLPVHMICFYLLGRAVWDWS